MCILCMCNAQWFPNDNIILEERPIEDLYGTYIIKTHINIRFFFHVMSVIFKILLGILNSIFCSLRSSMCVSIPNQPFLACSWISSVQSQISVQIQCMCRHHCLKQILKSQYKSTLIFGFVFFFNYYMKLTNNTIS